MRLISLYIVAAMTMASCSSSTSERAAGSHNSSKTPMPVELPLPAIPDSLTVPERRAAYVAMHFWDAMDWKDHARSLDTAFVEQNFANYLTVLPLADTA